MKKIVNYFNEGIEEFSIQFIVRNSMLAIAIMCVSLLIKYFI